MDETGIHEQVKRWLGQKEHLALLENISKGCLFELEKRGLSHIVFLDTNPSVEDRQREILSCLFHFLLENSHIHAVLITGERNKAAMIKRSFINHLTNQARSKDAFRKVYRNAQAAIRNSGNLDIKQKTDKALYFFFAQQKNLQPVLMTKDGLQEIEFPESICPNHTYSQMNRKKILAPLAVYFLEKTGHVFETTAPCVSLNMLVEWIGIHVPFSAGRAPSTTIEHTTDNGFYHAEAVECASAFSNRLSADEKQIFFMFHCAGLTHKEAALKSGSRSNLSYQKAKVERKLKELLVPFPWYRDEKSFRHFRQTVCSNIESVLETGGAEAVYRNKKNNKKV